MEPSEGAEVEERGVLMSDVVCERMRRRETGGGGRVERVRKEREKGLDVARGGLDEVPPFRRYANVAHCDIIEEVVWGCKHVQGHCHTHYGFRMSRSLKTSTSTSECQ